MVMPALLLEVHGVEELLGHLALGERPRALEQAVGERGLAVVDVGDDREVADVLCMEASDAASGPEGLAHPSPAEDHHLSGALTSRRPRPFSSQATGRVQAEEPIRPGRAEAASPGPAPARRPDRPAPPPPCRLMKTSRNSSGGSPARDSQSANTSSISAPAARASGMAKSWGRRSFEELAQHPVPAVFGSMLEEQALGLEDTGVAPAHAPAHAPSSRRTSSASRSSDSNKPIDYSPRRPRGGGPRNCPWLNGARGDGKNGKHCSPKQLAADLRGARCSPGRRNVRREERGMLGRSSRSTIPR